MLSRTVMTNETSYQVARLLPESIMEESKAMASRTAELGGTNCREVEEHAKDEII